MSEVIMILAMAGYYLHWICNSKSCVWVLLVGCYYSYCFDLAVSWFKVETFGFNDLLEGI